MVDNEVLVALFDDAGNELSGNGYVRGRVKLIYDAERNYVTNENETEFGTATEDWTVITGFKLLQKETDKQINRGYFAVGGQVVRKNRRFKCAARAIRIQWFNGEEKCSK